MMPELSKHGRARGGWSAGETEGRLYGIKGAPRCRACRGPMALPGATHPACDPAMPQLRALSRRARREPDGSLVVRLEGGAELVYRKASA